MCNKVSDTYMLRQTQENVISAEGEKEFRISFFNSLLILYTQDMVSETARTRRCFLLLDSALTNRPKSSVSEDLSCQEFFWFTST